MSTERTAENSAATRVVARAGAGLTVVVVATVALASWVPGRGHDWPGVERIRTVVPCDHFEWQPPHIRKANACGPDLSPNTRDPESSAATNGTPHTPHGCSSVEAR